HTTHHTPATSTTTPTTTPTTSTTTPTTTPTTSTTTSTTTGTPSTSSSTALPTSSSTVPTPKPCTCEWSDWFDLGAPTPGPDGGDTESISQLIKSRRIGCTQATKVECRAKMYPTLPLSQLGQDVICSPSVGLVCLNKNQGNKQECFDYEIRVQCCGACPDTTTTTTTPTPTPTTTTPTPTTTTSTTTPTTTTLSTTSITHSTVTAHPASFTTVSSTTFTVRTGPTFKPSPQVVLSTTTKKPSPPCNGCEDVNGKLHPAGKCL